MKVHPLICHIAKSLAYNHSVDWELCVPDAKAAVEALTDWVESLHISAQANLLEPDMFVTTAYLRSVLNEFCSDDD